MSDNGATLLHEDCLVALRRLEGASVDLVYLDPPFFTNKSHSAVTRDRTRTFSFADAWGGLNDYAQFMKERLAEVWRVLKPTGSIFVHCDTSANSLLRFLLDEIFGKDQFRSEIVWSYRRWSNASRTLLPSHQTIFFYSRSAAYKFNRTYTPYSETTNVDQILQLRSRDEHGVSIYATDDSGNVLYGSERKKGVPLSDVWEIPYLNPKAKERTGYPTQKPVLLLERIIAIASEPGDLVVDPFCGSGTTLVAAALLGRRSFGVDSSPDAIEIARQRLRNPSKTDSALLRKGRSAYLNADMGALEMLKGLDVIPVHRNAGIDAFARAPDGGDLIPVRVQRKGESLASAAGALAKAANSKAASIAILVRTQIDDCRLNDTNVPSMIKVVETPDVQIHEQLSRASCMRGAHKPGKDPERLALDMSRQLQPGS